MELMVTFRGTAAPDFIALLLQHKVSIVNFTPVYIWNSIRPETVDIYVTVSFSEPWHLQYSVHCVTDKTNGYAS